MNKTQKKKRDYEFLVLALRLAITAPDEEAKQCANLLRGFDLSDKKTLDRAKTEALRQIEEQKGRKIFKKGGPSSHA